MANQELLPHGLPQIQRLITHHNKEGKAIFSSAVDESLEWEDVGDIAKFGLGYTTSQFPVSFEADKDLNDYQSTLQQKPGITIPGGTVLRVVDMAPGVCSPMHRTISLDYGVVLEGEVELELDSGEKRVMKRGDISIQRGTNHLWRNMSSTTWARMMYVLQESEALKFDGKALGEDYGSGMPGVRASSH